MTHSATRGVFRPRKASRGERFAGPIPPALIVPCSGNVRSERCAASGRGLDDLDDGGGLGCSFHKGSSLIHGYQSRRPPFSRALGRS